MISTWAAAGDGPQLAARRARIDQGSNRGGLRMAGMIDRRSAVEPLGHEMAAVIDEAAPGVETPAVGVVVVDLQMKSHDPGSPAARLHRVEKAIPDATVAPAGPDVQLVDEGIAAPVLEAEAAAEDA